MQIQTHLKKETEPKNLTEKVMYRGEVYPMGQQIQIESSDESFPEVLFVPLVGGRETIVQVSTMNPKVIPLQNVDYENETFPAVNGLFYHTQHQSSEDPHRKIESISPEMKRIATFLMDSYKANQELLKKHQQEMPQVPILEKSVARDLRRIVKEDMGLSTKKRNTMDMSEVMNAIYMFVAAHSSSEEVTAANSENIRHLLGMFKENYAFPGDCKSISTVVVGIGAALGIPGRRVEGQVLDTRSGTIEAGHVWAEQYIPTLNMWVPNDPAFGAFIAYSDKGSIYTIAGKILPQEATTVTVSYQPLRAKDRFAKYKK